VVLTVVDAAALAQFQEQWSTYRKLVESSLQTGKSFSTRTTEIAVQFRQARYSLFRERRSKR
jgi:glucose-6-phosphate 1-dehydrogenase